MNYNCHNSAPKHYGLKQKSSLERVSNKYIIRFQSNNQNMREVYFITQLQNVTLNLVLLYTKFTQEKKIINDQCKSTSILNISVIYF